MERPILYQKLIAPVLYYTGLSYELKKKYIEDPVVWHPEEMEYELRIKYKELNTNWNILTFEQRYEVYTQSDQ